MAKISVAMGTYNGERFLEQQLGSIINQTRLPDEIIICDDASQDNTLEILKYFQQSVSHLPVSVIIKCNLHNLGVAKNFEQAIQLSNGDYIACADQDDIWHPEKLARLEAILDAEPDIGLVFSDAEVVNEALEPSQTSLWEAIGFTHEEQLKIRKGHSLEVLLKHRVVTGATMMFRARYRSIFMPISELWIHDAWISLLIALQARLLPLPEKLIQYRQHRHNQIGAMDTGIKAHLDRAKSRGRAEQTRFLREYQVIREYIAWFGDSSPDFLRWIDEKIAHLSRRACLPSGRFLRLYPILIEIVNMRYFRYSSGFRSILKDILLE